MKKIIFLGLFVGLISSLIIFFNIYYLKSSNNSSCLPHPQLIIAHVKAGAFRADTEKLLQSSGMTLEGNLRFEPQVELIPASEDIGQEYISELKKNPDVVVVKIVNLETGQISVRFKEGSTREKVTEILTQLNISFTKQNDYIDSEIIIKTPIGKEDYYMKLLQENFPQFLDARRSMGCPVGRPPINTSKQ